LLSQTSASVDGFLKAGGIEENDIVVIVRGACIDGLNFLSAGMQFMAIVA